MRHPSTLAFIYDGRTAPHYASLAREGLRPLIYLYDFLFLNLKNISSRYIFVRNLKCALFDNKKSPVARLNKK